MDYRYQEIVDWGIIRRQWLTEDDSFLILLELHEEDRFTVIIRQHDGNLVYNSFCRANGKLTFASLDDAMEHAALQLQRLHSANFPYKP